MSSIDWQPEIGDPTFMGWATVLAYFVTSICCIAVLVRASSRDESIAFASNPRESAWLFLALLLCALGINKQLDLQSLVTQTGRWVIRSLALYEYRRLLQISFIVVVVIVATSGLFYLRRATRDRWDEFGLSLIGVVFLLGFIVVRAASFHGFDRLLDVRVIGLRLNWILELGGIALIAAGALRRLKS